MTNKNMNSLLFGRTEEDYHSGESIRLNGEKRQLRDMEGEVIEIVLSYESGHATIFGRVRIINGSQARFIAIGENGGCYLPIDAEVRVRTHARSDTIEDIDYTVNV